MSIFNKTAVGLVILVGVVNAGAMIGNSLRQPIKTHQISYPPAGEFTSYSVSVSPDGSYTVDYRGHDPRLSESTEYVDQSNGVFGVGGRSTNTRTRQYIAGSGEVVETEKTDARSEECIKAEGGGESNGALVGASIASGLAPAVSGIPYVGWLASGWAVMFGQDLGSSVGGQIATAVKGC